MPSGLFPEKSPARFRARAVLGLRPHFVPSGGPGKHGPMANTSPRLNFEFTENSVEGEPRGPLTVTRRTNQPPRPDPPPQKYSRYKLYLFLLFMNFYRMHVKPSARPIVLALPLCHPDG